jgi:hypothetical protein
MLGLAELVTRTKTATDEKPRPRGSTDEALPSLAARLPPQRPLLRQRGSRLFRPLLSIPLERPQQWTLIPKNLLSRLLIVGPAARTFWMPMEELAVQPLVLINPQVAPEDASR